MHINKHFPLSIAATFDAADDFHEGLSAVNIGGKWGFIDQEGQVIVKPQYDEVGHFSNGAVRARIKYKWFFINKQGNTLGQLKFDEAFDFSEGLARVRLNQGWGYLNLEGEFAIQPNYQGADDFHEGLAAVQLNDIWGYIYKNEKWFISPMFYKAFAFSDGLACVRENRNSPHKYRYIDRWVGKYVSELTDLNCEFSPHDGMFHDGLVLNDLSFINKRGEEVIRSGARHGERYLNWQAKNVQYLGYNTVLFYGVHEFHDGLARISVRVGQGKPYNEKEYREGFIDNRGKYAISPLLTEAGDFSEGLAAFKMNHKWGYLNKQGAILVSPQFDAVGEFHEGLARVEIGNLWGFIKLK